MMKILKYSLVLLAGFLLSCQQDPTVSFTFEPHNPRAGEKVRFNNLTTEGEEWLWNYGDGNESTSHSPSKIFEEPGNYTVTLTVDNKKSRSYSQVIVVRDTVPMIQCSKDTIPYYETVTLSVDFYNPNDEDVKYAWNLPESAHIISGELDEEKLEVYFTEKDILVPIELQLTLGTTKHNLNRSFYVKDTQSTTIICVTDEGKLMRQRIYANGVEEIAALPISNPIQANDLLIEEDALFVLGNGIFEVNLADFAVNQLHEDVAKTGCLNKRFLYYTEGTSIFSLHTITQHATLFASADKLQDFPTTIRCIGYFSSLYFVAGEKGIYRFAVADINSGQKPATAPILEDYVIDDLRIDHIARKVYFIANKALYVSNVDGSYTTQIADNALAITLSNSASRVYVATTSGVGYLPLIQTPNNTTTAKITYLNEVTNIRALAVYQ